VCATPGKVNAVNLSGAVVDYSAQFLDSYTRNVAGANTSPCWTVGLPFLPIPKSQIPNF